MSKHMLIDASHPEETRVAVVDGKSIEELDFEIAAKRQLRGNVYLAKVTRVEPSLQAAFIEYGGNRHGFLAFNEIHPDYFQIPNADRQELLREAAAAEQEAEQHEDEDDADEALERRRARMLRKYKIQDVIRRRQILLVQVVKEERGNKGAALTTYLSLAGRYCVLMPNTGRGGGISRKISNAADRKRLKSAVSSLEVPQGMGLIIRTAGASRTKAEIKRDYDYLLRLWESIRESTLKAVAPTLIYAEEDLVKRAVRDMFDKDFESVQVEGYDGYKEARDFMRMLMPSQAAKVHHYTEGVPLFARYGIEERIAQIHSPVVPLRSGGYLVINQTEALVAVDVNSGKATRERNIEQTALKTNLEAAEEAARQLRLRDLAGLIVIDFIDMDEGKNDRAVEKCLKDALRSDRARVQMGRISQFGLLEISRQRRRMGVLEGSTHVCSHCQGAGRVRSVESSALGALRELDMDAVRNGAGSVTLKVCPEVGLYVLNEKREYLQQLFETHGVRVIVAFEEALVPGEQELERTGGRESEYRPVARVQAPPIQPEPQAGGDEDASADEDEDDVEGTEVAADGARPPRVAEPREGDEEGRRGRGRRRRRRGGRGREDGAEPALDGDADVAAAGSDAEDEDGAEGAPTGERLADEKGEDGRGRRRRRGRRGGRRTREEDEAAGAAQPYAWSDPAGASGPDAYAWSDPHAPRSRRESPDFAAPPPASEGEPAEALRSEPAPGPQVEAAPGQDPYGWDAAEPAAAEAAAHPAGALPGRDAAANDVDSGSEARRPRRRRGAGRPAAEEAQVAPAVAEATAPLATAVVATEVVATEVEEQEVAEAPAAEAASTPAPSTIAPAPEAEPDPNEISAPPAQPRRGWWNRLRGG